MEIMAEGTHTGFLKKITGKRARRKADRTWYNTAAEEVREAAGTQSDTTYIVRRQQTMENWVVLRPTFEVCAREMGYDGGGHRRNAWWRQDALDTQNRENLEEI